MITDSTTFQLSAHTHICVPFLVQAPSPAGVGHRPIPSGRDVIRPEIAGVEVDSRKESDEKKYRDEGVMSQDDLQQRQLKE